MEEVCGYKGLDGKFYETEKACKKADLDYKIKDIGRVLDNFSSRLASDLFFQGDHKLNLEFERNETRMLEMVAKHVLRDSDDFIEVINKKKELEKELDELQKLRKDSWWLKLKWW